METDSSTSEKKGEGEEAYIEKNLKNGKRNSQNDKHNKDGNLMKKIASDDEATEGRKKLKMKEPSKTVRKSGKKKRKIAMETVKAEFIKAEKLAKKMGVQAAILEASNPDKEENNDFKCDKCGTGFITNPMVRGNKVKKSKYLPSPRHKMDPVTKKILSLCNACGLAFNRPKKVKKNLKQINSEAKEKYLKEGQKYADELTKNLGIEEARRFYCPYYTKTSCKCIQKFIGDVNTQQAMENARTLLSIMSKAKQYKSVKSRDEEELMTIDSQDEDYDDDGDEEEEDADLNRQRQLTKRTSFTVGNGHKKSKQFETYVLEQRAWLKAKYHFCEASSKKILLYSNNFLHKRLKTDPERACRVVRQKGMIALGKLTSIKDLPKEQCCVDHCVRMALTHQTLLQQWRDRSKQGQAEARRVIGEMLTPSGGSRTNCYKFVSWVTGRSMTTIGKVNEQMKKTGGNREPPEHGLKNWWKNHPKPKKDRTEQKASLKATAKSTTASLFSQDSATSIFNTALLQPNSILQTAANTSGLTAIIQNQQQQQQQQQNRQKQQQQQQSLSSPLANNASIITINAPFPQSFITIPASPLGLSMNLQIPNLQIQQQLPLQPVQQVQLIQQQQPQQQNSQTFAIAINQLPSMVRQQATAPTMVSNGNQIGTCLITPASTNILETVSESSVPQLITTQQQPQTNTSQQNVQLPATQFVQIAPAPSHQSPLILHNSLPGIINLTPQLQHGNLTPTGNLVLTSPANISIVSSGSLPVPITPSTGGLNVSSSVNLNLTSSGNLSLLSSVSVPSTTDSILSTEATLPTLNSAVIGSVPAAGTQFGQLISQNGNSTVVVNPTSMPVTFISGT